MVGPMWGNQAVALPSSSSRGRTHTEEVGCRPLGRWAARPREVPILCSGLHSQNNAQTRPMSLAPGPLPPHPSLATLPPSAGPSDLISCSKPSLVLLKPDRPVVPQGLRGRLSPWAVALTHSLPAEWGGLGAQGRGTGEGPRVSGPEGAWGAACLGAHTGACPDSSHFLEPSWAAGPCDSAGQQATAPTGWTAPCRPQRGWLGPWAALWPGGGGVARLCKGSRQRRQAQPRPQGNGNEWGLGVPAPPSSWMGESESWPGPSFPLGRRWTVMS